jgi:hypothetical protein
MPEEMGKVVVGNGSKKKGLPKEASLFHAA